MEGHHQVEGYLSRFQPGAVPTATDPVWWRPAPGEPYRRLAADDVIALRQAFAEAGRERMLA